MHLNLPAIVGNLKSAMKKKKHCYLFQSSFQLVRTPVYCTVHDILTHTLIHLRGVEKNLKYWQSVHDKGLLSVSDAPPTPEIALFFQLRRSLSTFLSKVYAENDMFNRPAYLRWDRSRLLVLYIRNIINHFIELEESIHDKIPYPAPPTGSLSFLKLGDENDEDLMLRWSADNFQDAVNLLSTNLNKLDDYVSFFTLANSRYYELMKLKQVQSTRDYSSAKELTYPAQNLSGEGSARPKLNQIQKLKLTAETLRESFELRHEISVANERIVATLAAIPALVFNFGGLMISWVLVEQVAGRYVFNNWKQKKGNQGRNAGPRARLLVKEVEERFKEYKTQSSQNDRHYNHGLILCTLDRLDRAVESSAKKTGEWDSLREELTDLGKLNYPDSDKLVAISHFKEAYACLSPPPRSGASGWWAW